MADFYDQMTGDTNLTVDQQKKIGQAAAGTMDEEHRNFLKTVIGMLDRNEIDVFDPDSFLKHEIYDPLPLEWKAKVDMALPNITNELRRIESFYRSKDTPDSSPILQNMIEHLWQMKQRIEDHYDVFKF